MKSFIVELYRINQSIEKDKFRILKPINCDDYQLSIQGSSYHYCEPRLTLPLEEYESMEIAIIKDGDFVDINSDSVFSEFERLEELGEYSDGYGVFARVPVDLIEDLYQFLKNA